MDGQQQTKSVFVANCSHASRYMLKYSYVVPDGTAEQQFALMLLDRIIQAEKRIVALERVQPVPPATRMAAIGSTRYFKFSFWAFQDSFDPKKNPFYNVPGHMTTTMNFCTHLLQDARGDLIADFLQEIKRTQKQKTPRRSRLQNPFSLSFVHLPDINQAFLRQVLVVEGVISTEENQSDAAYLAAVLESTWGDCWTGDHGECAHQCLDLDALGITRHDISGAQFHEAMTSRPYVREINDGQAWEEIFEALSTGGTWLLVE